MKQSSHHRIQFLRVGKSGWLKEHLQNHLQIDPEQADFLIHFGAIYCNFKRVTENIFLIDGDLLRCHTQPKRFLSKVDWDSRIIDATDDYLVIDKPSGLPCQPSLDNRIENVLFQLQQATKQNLFITHRLDVGTRGLMVFAKNTIFQTNFNRALEQRQVIKIYEALTLGPRVHPQTLTHWMRPQARAPKILAQAPVQDWKICQLEILESELLVPSLLSQVHSKDRGINYYRLQLHTGRTHQIRAQLSFEQNPLLGDTLYGGISHQLPFDWHALQCSELQFDYQDHFQHWTLPSLKNQQPSVHEIAP
jgi:23S rRNA pseudouridine1911/1915/1917 synthase